ncbi:MAG: Na+/H+ antiporter NhaC family protein, partial [Deferribacterota bacterium]|nr:Na+/H+ antiporter NhaC family protein [Deferribacterota bacterium]
MIKRKLIIFLIIFISLIATSSYSSNSYGPASSYGIWSVVPPLIAILLAFISRNVIVSLLIAIYIGGLIISIDGNNLLAAFVVAYVKVVNYILHSLADPWNAGIILQCLTIGGLIALLNKVGGMNAIANKLAKRAKTPMGTQLITWLLGFFIFFDDYANSLITGPIMRPLTDKMRVSREKLAFIIDSTAAPIAGIALISTWVAYEIGLIRDAFKYLSIDLNPYVVFVETIPYRFYNILILIFVPLTALLMRDFGPMLKAESRAREKGKVLSDSAKPMITDEALKISLKNGIKVSYWDALIPLFVLIIASFLGFYLDGYFRIMSGENQEYIRLLKEAPLDFTSIWIAFGKSDASIVLFQAALLASIFSAVMTIIKRQFAVTEAINTWLTGVKSLNLTAVILLLAWSLSAVMKELKTAEYLVGLLSNRFPIIILPATIFLLGAVTSFATGTSYGTMGILMPLCVPLAFSLNPSHEYLIINISAVLTGAIFGDHCSPISDTTILSSMG